MKQLLVLFFLLCSASVFAQDVIVKKDGSTILSKVLEVNTADVKYKKISNLEGPTYTISKSEIMAINYKNGEKELFEEQHVTSSNESYSYSKRLDKEIVDDKNSEIISLYNHIYSPTNKVDISNSFAKCYLIIFGIKGCSILSNEDIEISFVRNKIESPYGGEYAVYHINLTNKTGKTIYIDKGNSFKVLKSGDYSCYYDSSEQMTVNAGSGSNSSLGLGSIASVLGIGGSVGQIAGNISVGRGSMHSVSKTYSQQRIIAIPPHGKKNLSEERYVKVSKGNILSDAAYTWIEEAEHFNFVADDELGLDKKSVKRGQTITYNEAESPWMADYFITYSTDETFNTFSTVNIGLFVHEIIGCQSIFWKGDSENIEKYIDGYNKYTIAGWGFYM